MSALALCGLREFATLPTRQLAIEAGARGLLLATFGYALQRTFQHRADVPGLMPPSSTRCRSR